MPHSASRSYRHRRSPTPISDSDPETMSDVSSVEEMKVSSTRRKSNKRRSAGGSSKHRSKSGKSGKSPRSRSRSRSRSSSRSDSRRHRKSRRVDRTIIISDSSDVDEVAVVAAPPKDVADPTAVEDIPLPPPLTAPVALAPLPKVDAGAAVAAALASLPPPPPPPMPHPQPTSPQGQPLDLSASTAAAVGAGVTVRPEAHVQLFGVNAGSVQPAAATPPSNGEELPGYMGSGINLNVEAIKDLSNTGTSERLRRVHLFQMGGGYFFRVGPTPFHAQGGTYDSVAFGRVTDGKNPGDKPKTSVVHIPIRATPQLVEGLTKLRERFDDRKPVTLQEVILMADTTTGDIDLSSRIEFTAPKEGYKIDAGHIIAGETVAINKTSSFEAITICRLPKLCGYNGKPTQKYSLHIPLRFLPTMQTLATFALQMWSGEAVPSEHM